MKKSVITLLISAFFMTSAANARMDPSKDGYDRSIKPDNIPVADIGVLDDGTTDAFSVPDPYSSTGGEIVLTGNEGSHTVNTIYPEVQNTGGTGPDVDEAVHFARDAAILAKTSANTAEKAAAYSEMTSILVEQYKNQAQEHAETAGNYARETAAAAESVKNSHDTISANAISVQSLEKRSQVLEESQATVTDTVSNLTGRVNNVVKKQSATSRVADNNTRAIDKITGQQKTNTRHILENRNDIRAIEQALRETSERLDNGLAASAALNGLFQPYGVGKLNITAAMGGYQSTQAIAVGTGYRFNENIAVKTGVAYTGSNDVMYNMAFNLEW